MLQLLFCPRMCPLSLLLPFLAQAPFPSGLWGFPFSGAGSHFLTHPVHKHGCFHHESLSGNWAHKNHSQGISLLKEILKAVHVLAKWTECVICVSCWCYYHFYNLWLLKTIWRQSLELVQVKRNSKFSWSAEVSGWCRCFFKGFGSLSFAVIPEHWFCRAVASPLTRKYFQQLRQSLRGISLCQRKQLSLQSTKSDRVMATSLERERGVGLQLPGGENGLLHWPWWFEHCLAVLRGSLMLRVECECVYVCVCVCVCVLMVTRESKLWHHMAVNVKSWHWAALWSQTSFWSSLSLVVFLYKMHTAKCLCELERMRSAVNISLSYRGW